MDSATERSRARNNPVKPEQTAWAVGLALLGPLSSAGAAQGAAAAGSPTRCHSGAFGQPCPCLRREGDSSSWRPPGRTSFCLQDLPSGLSTILLLLLVWDFLCSAFHWFLQWLLQTSFTDVIFPDVYCMEVWNHIHFYLYFTAVCLFKTKLVTVYRVRFGQQQLSWFFFLHITVFIHSRH